MNDWKSLGDFAKTLYGDVLGEEPNKEERLASIRRKIKRANEEEGSLNKKDGYDCPICKNKGVIYKEYETDEQTLLYEYKQSWCSCHQKRLDIARAKKSGLGDYLNKRSSDYIATTPWQTEVKKMMIEYCQNRSLDNVWYMIVGCSGGGKTLIGSIIANNLLNNTSRIVKYITWTDFVSKIKRYMMNDDIDNVNYYLNTIKTVDVLFLDEVLKVYNDTDLKYLIEIINYRYNNNKKTIITSEKSIDELLNIDEATFGRVIEKSEQFIYDIPKTRDNNYRLRNIPRGK